MIHAGTAAGKPPADSSTGPMMDDLGLAKLLEDLNLPCCCEYAQVHSRRRHNPQCGGAGYKGKTHPECKEPPQRWWLVDPMVFEKNLHRTLTQEHIERRLITAEGTREHRAADASTDTAELRYHLGHRDQRLARADLAGVIGGEGLGR